VIRPGGWLVASTNDHDADGLWQLSVDAGLDRAPISARWPLDGAARAVRTAGFDDVEEQVFDYELAVPSTQPVLDYLDSRRSGFPDVTDKAWHDVRRTVADTVAARIAWHGAVCRTGRVGIIAARRLRHGRASRALGGK